MHTAAAVVNRGALPTFARQGCAVTRLPGREEPDDGRDGADAMDVLAEAGDRPVRRADGRNRQQQRHALVAINM